jgi:hypothetical protein
LPTVSIASSSRSLLIAMICFHALILTRSRYARYA